MFVPVSLVCAIESPGSTFCSVLLWPVAIAFDSGMQVLLLGATIEPTSSKTDKMHPHTISLTPLNEERTYVFSSTAETARDEWVRALKEQTEYKDEDRNGTSARRGAARGVTSLDPADLELTETKISSLVSSSVGGSQGMPMSESHAASSERQRLDLGLDDSMMEEDSTMMVMNPLRSNNRDQDGSNHSEERFPFKNALASDIFDASTSECIDLLAFNVYPKYAHDPKVLALQGQLKETEEVHQELERIRAPTRLRSATRMAGLSRSPSDLEEGGIELQNANTSPLPATRSTSILTRADEGNGLVDLIVSRPSSMQSISGVLSSEEEEEDGGSQLGALAPPQVGALDDTSEIDEQVVA